MTDAVEEIKEKLNEQKRFEVEERDGQKIAVKGAFDKYEDNSRHIGSFDTFAEAVMAARDAAVAYLNKLASLEQMPDGNFNVFIIDNFPASNNCAKEWKITQGNMVVPTKWNKPCHECGDCSKK